MSNQDSTFKNPVFWSVVAFIAGIGIGAWGMIKEDCNGGPGCWIGSGFLEWTGGVLIVLALIGMFTLGNRK